MTITSTSLTLKKKQMLWANFVILQHAGMNSRGDWCECRRARAKFHNIVVIDVHSLAKKKLGGRGMTRRPEEGTLGQLLPGIWKWWRHMPFPWKILFARAFDAYIKYPKIKSTMPKNRENFRSRLKVGHFCQSTRFCPLRKKFLRAPMSMAKNQEGAWPWAPAEGGTCPVT